MITSFKHKGLHKLFAFGDRRGIPAACGQRILRMLDRLNGSQEARDMDLPGYKLHLLKGTRQGTYSVHVSGNWRITFRFANHDVVDVNLEDYH